MRVGFRVSQFRGDPIFQFLRDKMFQPFRLIVNFVPGIVEEIMEKTLQQAVMAKNLQSAHPPGCRQTHAAVLFVFHKWRFLGRELLEHSRYGCGTDAEMPGERVAGHAFFFRPGQFQDGFQIIVYRFRSVRPMFSRLH